MVSDPLLEGLAARDSAAPAVESPAGTWTWADLRAAAEASAAALAGIGIGPGDRVAIEANLAPSTLAALLGVRLVGAVACPCDPRGFAAREETLAPAAVVAGGAIVPRAGGRRVDAAWGVATSGSTGAPRTAGLMPQGVDHVARTVAALLGLHAGDRIVSPLPLFHTYGLSQLWLAIHTGARLVFPASPLPGDLAAALHPGDVLAAVPATVRAVLAAKPAARPRLVTLAGQGCPAADRAAFAAPWPDTAFVLFYGLTEATTRVLWTPPERFLHGASGVPIPGVEARLAADGELCVRGPNVFAGYLDDPDATAARLVDGWLHTGDLFAREAEGLRFLGRRDGVFKRFGEKVIPESIEAALREHPAVAAALVRGERGGDGELAPIAWYVPRGEAPSPGELLRHLRTRLPPASLPAAFHPVAQLPETPTGKPRRAPPEEGSP